MGKRLKALLVMALCVCMLAGTVHYASAEETVTDTQNESTEAVAGSVDTTGGVEDLATTDDSEGENQPVADDSRYDTSTDVDLEEETESDAGETDEESVEAEAEEADEESAETDSAETTVVEVVNSLPDTTGEVVTMDGTRETPELYTMDEDGNLYLMEEDEDAAVVSDGRYMANASDVKIVNFRATSTGETVSSSSTTSYTEYSTGNSGYVCGAYGADAAYLGTEDGKVKFMLSGVVGLVDASKVQVISLSQAASYSCYYADGTNLIHRITTNMTTSGWGSSLVVGRQPSYLSKGSTYYSYDGHYFYKDYATMISDYQKNIRSNSVNSSSPYYNYYQFLPLRSTSNYSGSELSSLINSGSTSMSSSSKMYNTGTVFANYQNTYGTNALLMVGVAANESAWGTSTYAQQRNNLFGINAVDSNPDNAKQFSSVDTCIKDYAETYLSKHYLNANYTYYHGGYLGDKSSGINVSWASDPYWGEKAANVAWSLDKSGGYQDRNKYTIGIKNTISTNHTNVNVRKEATTSSTILYTTGKSSNYAVIVKGSSGNFYRIQSDPVLNSGRTAIDSSTGVYSISNMYAYISKSYVTIVCGEDDFIDESTEGVGYSVYMQTYRWLSEKMDGQTAGITGEAKRLESIKISLRNQSVSGNIQYRAHCQTYGWQSWVQNGAVAGTSEQAKRLEAIQIKLTGEMAEKYDVYYRVYCQTYGWLGWAKNGQSAGSVGYAKRIEAIQIKLVAKGGAAPGSTTDHFKHTLVQYSAHGQTYGWQSWVTEGVTAGTVGNAKRLEAIRITLQNQDVSGSIEYRTHVQTYGWQDWKSSGTIAGTTGQKKRMEAICIRLTGDMAERYDIYYRVHSQTYGWLGWAKNGEKAGTEGLGKRMEAIQIVLVEKGGAAPGSTATPFRTK